MNIQNQGPLFIHGRKPSEIESFIQPKGLLVGTQGKGVFAVTVVLGNLVKTISAKINRIIHAIKTHEWVTNKSIRASIGVTIYQLSTHLKAKPLTNEAEFHQEMEWRHWVNESVLELRHLCDSLKARGVKASKVDELTEALNDLILINGREGIREVDEWYSYSSKPKIQHRLADLIALVHEAKGSDYPLDELDQMADIDLKEAHPLFVVDHVTRAWNIIIAAFKPKDPPNDVLKQFGQIKDLMGCLTNAQKDVQGDKGVKTLEEIHALKTEDAFRSLLEEELKNLLELEKDRLPSKGWLRREQPVIVRIKHEDFAKKANPQEIKKDLKELQQLLDKGYRAKGEYIANSLYNRLAALYDIVDCLAAGQASKTIPEESPVDQSQQTLRLFIQQAYSDFIQELYTALPVPGSNPPIAFLDQQLPPAVNEQLKAIAGTDFKNAHNMFVLDLMQRAIQNIDVGISHYPNPQNLPPSLIEKYQVLLRLVTSLGFQQKAPQGITIDQIHGIHDKEELLKLVQNEVQTVIALEKSALAGWGIKPGWFSRGHPVLNELKKVDFVTLPLPQVEMAINALRKVIFDEFISHGEIIPDHIYDHFAALAEMNQQLNSLDQAEKLAMTPLAAQQKQRALIQKKLIKLINLAYSEYKILPPGSTEPVSLVEWNLGKQQGLVSAQNQELSRIKALDFTDFHNLRVLDWSDRVHELLFTAFNNSLPEELDHRFQKIEDLVDELDNSQKMAAMLEIPTSQQVKDIQDEKELRKILREGLTNLVKAGTASGLFSGRVFSMFSPENQVLYLAENNSPDFSTLPASQIWNTVFKLHHAITETCKKHQIEPSDPMYDYLAVLYQAAEGLVDLDNSKE